MRKTTKTTEIVTEKAQDIAKKMREWLKEDAKLPKLLVILGPTASGKTALSLELARLLNGEIISADSRQIYREIDIGSDKISLETLSETSLETLSKTPPKTHTPQQPNAKKLFYHDGIIHHMIDIVSPENIYTMSDFKRDAEKCIEEILQRDRLPMLVGGTGLYIRAITENFHLSSKRGKKSQKKGPKKYDVFILGVVWPREKMYERVNGRVEEQMKKGLIEEARVLLEKYDNKTDVTSPHSFSASQAPSGFSTLPAFSSLGLKEFSAYFSGEITLDEVTERIKKNTRNYAKRQITWFKKDKDVHWLNGGKAVEEFAKDVANFSRAILRT